MNKNIYAYCIIAPGQLSKKKQIELVKEQGVSQNNIYFDKASRNGSGRAVFNELMDNIIPGDLLYIKSVDVLGDDYSDVIERWTYITKTKKADICVIDTPILDTRTANDLLGTVMTDVVVSLMSYIVESERDVRKKKQAEGIAEAKENGVHFGRKKRLLPDNFEEIVNRWRAKEISVDEAAKMCGMAKSTFYSRAKEVD